jgi:uncharacterized protein (TIGR03437 family)
VEQVNFQVPFETTGDRASIVVVRDGQSSTPLEAALLPVQPGIFTTNGSDAIVVRHSDNTLVTAARPLQRGDYGYLYVTGLGATENPPATGRAAPRSPLAVARTLPSITIDGVLCEVLFAGLAPDFVAVYQVNFRVASNVAAGSRDLVVSSAGISSRIAKVFIQ